MQKAGRCHNADKPCNLLSCHNPPRLLGAPRLRAKAAAHAAVIKARTAHPIKGHRRVGISGGITASLAGRYASALYALAGEHGAVAAIEADLDRVSAAVTDSADLAKLLSDPQISRDAASRAVKAVAEVLTLNPLTANFLGVLAGNRRLDRLPEIIRAFAAIAADARGEITADVTTAHPLQPNQIDALSAKLAQLEGRAVTLRTHIDPALLGGLVVQIGSQMIDGSIRTRLNSLAQAVKG